MFQKQQTMKELPESQQPYEKFLSHGAESLSDAELLAVILRTGTKGVSVLSLCNKVLGMGRERNILNLERLTLSELKKIPGIGQVKAEQIKCVAEISRRFAKAERHNGILYGRIPYENSGTYAFDYVEYQKRIDWRESSI